VPTADRPDRCHRYMVEQGRCIFHRRMWFGETWWEGLRLHFEVWDDWDGFLMLSAEGTMGVVADVDEGVTYLRLTGSDRCEVRAMVFINRATPRASASRAKTWRGPIVILSIIIIIIITTTVIISIIIL
jgi:hypothetical protein